MPIPQAVYDTVIVEVIYKTITSGSIIIPNTVTNTIEYNADHYGLVVSVGPDYRYKLKVGDKVIFRKLEGFELFVGDTKYMNLRSRWVEATVEEE